MRKELARYFKAQIEPITQEDLSLLAKAGIKHRPFFKSTKGINCLAVFAWNGTSCWIIIQGRPALCRPEARKHRQDK